jgi:hypothetical protein
MYCGGGASSVAMVQHPRDARVQLAEVLSLCESGVHERINGLAGFT